MRSHRWDPTCAGYFWQSGDLASVFGGMWRYMPFPITSALQLARYVRRARMVRD